MSKSDARNAFPSPEAFWGRHVGDVMRQLGTCPEGISDAEARARRGHFGPNVLKKGRRTDALHLLLRQFSSPISLILIFAASLSFLLQDSTEATIILVIVFASGLLGFWQERGAVHAVEKLLCLAQIKATVRRGRLVKEIAEEDAVPGDIVCLRAGDGVPGDCLLIEAKDLYVDEATLTGETCPVEKSVGVVSAATPLRERTNSVWMGTHVVSGSATVVIVRTGTATEFGKVSDRLVLRPPETEFERGVREFGQLLLRVTLLLLFVVFSINVYLARPVLESFLFALALAVGITPQMLPAVVTMNLAYGARHMAGVNVIVKRLEAIENFGSMNILCSDKTGTLTEGAVRLEAALDPEGARSDRVLRYACINAAFETGYVNPIDRALRDRQEVDLSTCRKLDEVPYDFVRKRLSILVDEGGTEPLMVTKGACANMLAVCSHVSGSSGETVDLRPLLGPIQQRCAEFNARGYRMLGVATKRIRGKRSITRDDESDMTFAGFLLFSDPPRVGITGTLDRLKDLGVTLKIITGDSALVAQNVSEQIGNRFPEVLTGEDLHALSDEALRVLALDVDVFAEIDPNQKERIICALKKSGNIVGYMGDGINDASALHAADVGLSVDSAADVAKEASDIVLPQKNLEVLEQAIREGRKTFANTLKYVFMSTSATFGTMISMAGASLFLPFLPLLPKQILLTNFLTDIPAMTIPSDNVDGELIDRPQRWSMASIRRFMVAFGLLSSVFDFLTFGVLLLLLHTGSVQFRTGWFLESVVSAALIVLVIRTRRPWVESKPGKNLVWSTLGIVAATLLLPFSPVSNLCGFSPMPIGYLATMGGIVVLYILAAEVMKKRFYGGGSCAPRSACEVGVE